MKVRHYLWGALFCLAMVGCSDEEGTPLVDNNAQQEMGKLEDVPAFITVSLSTSSNSSRAGVTGDSDGKQEDSGHHNAGTEGEQKVSDLVVVIKSLTQSSQNAANSGVVKHITSADEYTLTGQNGNRILTIKEKFKVLAGEHKVLVIVNPTTEIEAAVAAATDYKKIGELYDNLLKGKIGAASDDFGDEDDIQTPDHFMMTNNAEVTVKATAANSQTSPAQASILVERVISKITFRETTKTGEEANVYPIQFNYTIYGYNVVSVADNGTTTYYALATDAKGTVVAVKSSDTTIPVQTSFIDEKGQSTNYYSKFIADLDGNKNLQVYAYDKSTQQIGAQLTRRKLKDDTNIPGEAVYYVGDKDEWEKIEYDTDQTTIVNKIPPYVMETYYQQVTNWKVKLTEYALVNLNKDVYVVRHTADALGANIASFGFMDGQNYIADANFAEKNGAAATYSFNAYDTWTTEQQTAWNTAASGWFNNTLGDVAAETAGGTVTKSFFSALPGTTESPDDYEDGEHYTPNGTDNPGKLLAYCLETTTTTENQKHGLTTGIVFKSELIPADNSLTGTMYQYDKKVFATLDEVIKGYGYANDDIMDLGKLDKTQLTTEENEKKIIAAGVKIYQNGQCYYYTNQIKHFDNGDNSVAGNMEFAIVRNNIYSLAVKDIVGIGDASIDPNPGVDNESQVGYINIEARILPWIVRYNDIEF